MKYIEKYVVFLTICTIFLACSGCDSEEAILSGESPARQYQIAQIYLKSGVAGEQSDKGIRLLIQSADAGYVLAQNRLGFLYAQGVLVPRDLSTALHYYQLAASNGFAVSQYNLAEMYRSGAGVTRNDKVAFNWYLQSALKAYPAAMLRVCEAYLYGNGTQPDLSKAFAWQQLTSKAGFPVPEQIQQGILQQITVEELSAANQYLYQLAAQMEQ